MSSSFARRSVPRPGPRPPVSAAPAPLRTPLPAPLKTPTPIDPMRGRMQTLLGFGPVPKPVESAPLTRDQILEMLWDASPSEAARLQELLMSFAKVADAGEIEIRKKLETLDLGEDDILEAAPPVSHERPRRTPPPPPPVRRPALRVVDAAPAQTSPTDAMDLLFEAMYEMNFLESTADAARFCLESLAHALPTRAGLVHVLDPDSGDYVTLASMGPSAEHALGSHVAGDDWLVGAAACKHKPLVVNLDGDIPTRALDRHAFFGASASVVVSPVISWGRCLAVLELVDPAHGGHFDVRAEDALAYVATRFADFIADHGLDEPDGVRSRSRR